MSCFICSSNHYGTIAKTLFSFAKNNQLSDYVWPITQAAMPGSTTYHMFDNPQKIRGFLEDLISKMYRLNVETFCLKYGDEMAQEYEHPAPTMQDGKEFLEPAALYKALTCWRYQTIYELEYIKEVRELTSEEAACIELVEETISCIAEKMATQTAAYDRAEWGIN